MKIKGMIKRIKGKKKFNKVSKKGEKKKMKKNMFKVLAGVMMIGSMFVGTSHAKEMDDIILVSGKVKKIEYSQNPESTDWLECTDRLYFKVPGYTTYEVADFAEDMYEGDDVLVCIDTRGTECCDDDIIMMWRYWNPDQR